MTSFGKKILSAFVEVTEEQKAAVPAANATYANVSVANKSIATETSNKFQQYFDQLFREANLPGPDYYEFSKMIEAMNSIPDEKARYCAAFAGLNVQGLNKEKLLTTAADYLQLLEKDAANFQSTIDVALQQKVQGKKQELGEKSSRIQQLSQQINDLHQQIAVLQKEIKENEEKIANSSSGYQTELENSKAVIRQNIEKIKQHIS